MFNIFLLSIWPFIRFRVCVSSIFTTPLRLCQMCCYYGRR